MDHRLAVVIVPRNSVDPIQSSRALLEPFQMPRPGVVDGPFSPKFRFKRVGGWFDGLARGEVGAERWSTVLRMLLLGQATNEESPFAGFGPESGAEIEARIQADNTFDLDDLWVRAPSSIVVTPDGKWAAHGSPDEFEEPLSLAGGVSEESSEWARQKRALFWEYRGYTGVAWDVSWNFTGTQPEPLRPVAKSWGAHVRVSSTSPRAWSERIKAAQSAKAKRDASPEPTEEKAAVSRWEGEGGLNLRSRIGQ